MYLQTKVFYTEITLVKFMIVNQDYISHIYTFLYSKYPVIFLYAFSAATARGKEKNLKWTVAYTWEHKAG